MLGTTGAVYFVGALVLSGWLIAATLAVALDHSPKKARKLFLATIVYLPLILALMVLDKG